jgi:hypothetical protein
LEKIEPLRFDVEGDDDVEREDGEPRDDPARREAGEVRIHLRAMQRFCGRRRRRKVARVF